MIWQSLSQTATTVTKNNGVSGGISAIGWSFMKGISLPLSTLLGGLSTYYLFSLLLVYFIVGFIISENRCIALLDLY